MEDGRGENGSNRNRLTAGASEYHPRTCVHMRMLLKPPARRRGKRAQGSTASASSRRLPLLACSYPGRRGRRGGRVRGWAGAASRARRRRQRASRTGPSPTSGAAAAAAAGAGASGAEEKARTQLHSLPHPFSLSITCGSSARSRRANRRASDTALQGATGHSSRQALRIIRLSNAPRQRERHEEECRAHHVQRSVEGCGGDMGGQAAGRRAPDLARGERVREGCCERARCCWATSRGGGRQESLPRRR